MNSFAHLLIGKLLYTYLESDCGVTLHKESFFYGNILPDFTRRYKRQPHEAACWDAYLKDEIDALMEQHVPEQHFGRGYSRRLGIICHFYADFFCHAHTDAFDGGSYTHLLYEWDQYRFLRRHFEEIRRTGVEATVQAGAESTAVYAGFERLHREYLNLIPSLHNDILYTLSACAGAVAMITAGSAQWQPTESMLVYGTAEA